MIELVKFCNFIVHFYCIHVTGYNVLIQESKHCGYLMWGTGENDVSC